MVFFTTRHYLLNQRLDQVLSEHYSDLLDLTPDAMRTPLLFGYLAFILGFQNIHVHAQTLVADPSFVVGSGAQGGTDGSILIDLAIDGLGQVYVCGDFESYNGVSRRGLLRLSENGVMDPLFCSGPGSNEAVAAIGFQSSGKAIIGGRFSTFDGVATGGLTRLALDGSPDATFLANVDWEVTDLVIEPDDDIIACGRLLQAEGPRKLFRFSPDGVVDPTFNVSFLGDPWELKLQPDGKILIAGGVSIINGVPVDQLARLNADGTLDASFDAPAPYSENQVRALEIQPDGKILVGTPYTAGGGVSRLNANGSLDNTLTTSSFDFGLVFEIELLAGGRFIAVGDFGDINGSTAVDVALFAADGTLEATSSTGSDDFVYCVAADAQGRFVMGGSFTYFGGVPLNSLTRTLSCAATTFYSDTDGDGFGDPAVPLVACTAPSNYVANNTDNCPALPGVIGNSCSDGDSNTEGDVIDDACVCVGTPANIRLHVRAFLQGPFLGAAMSNGLVTAGLIPLVEPYTGSGYFHYGSGGGETTTLPTLNGGGDNDAIDWVVVEIRSVASPTTVLATRSALLQADGEVVNGDGTSDLIFPLPAGSYQVALHHRNHLGIMTNNPVAMSAVPVLIDFSLPSTTTYGTNAQKQIGGAMVMWGGDVNRDGLLQYTGSGNDRDLILVTVGSTAPNNTVNGYRAEDTSMNGIVSYIGSGNDRDLILVNIGSTIPTSIRTAQLP